MDTQFGPIREPDVFDEIVADVVEKGHALHGPLKQRMQAEWKNRPLDILIVDNPSLGAWADSDAARDYIYIHSGAIEVIYGTMLGLLSTPMFFPGIGDFKNEVRPRSIPDGEFPRISLLEITHGIEQNTHQLFPKNQTRTMLAQVMAELALEFLIYHEIGHIMGGHLEILRSSNHFASITEVQYAFNKPEDSSLRHVLECDADAFACHATSWIHTHDKMAEIMCELISDSKWQPTEFALLTYLISTGVIFHITSLKTVRTIDDCKMLSHPHPAVRACLIASSVIARGLDDSKYTSDLVNKVLADSMGHLEDVWVELGLSDQRPQPRDEWTKNVSEAALALFKSYGNTKTFLNGYARLPRHWDDWGWQEVQNPS